MSVSDWNQEKCIRMVNINLDGHAVKQSRGREAGDQSGRQEHTEAGTSNGDRVELAVNPRLIMQGNVSTSISC